MKTASQNTRERMLECAATLFDEKGYTTVSVDDICQAAAVSRATFYNHFSGKDALCYAFFTQEQIYSPSHISWILSGKTPVERLVRAHMCYMRQPTIRCAFDVYLARCQYLMTHPDIINQNGGEGFTTTFFLPFVEQAKEAGELTLETDLLAHIETFSYFQFGYDNSWMLYHHKMIYSLGLAIGMRQIYQIREDIPLEEYIDECMKA